MKSTIVSDPDIMGGTPCIMGTRVPFQTLLDCLMAGERLDDFLSGFPSVTRKLAIAALQETGDLLVAQVRQSVS